MKYIKIFLFSLFCLALFIAPFLSARADVINPEYNIKKCGAGQVEVVCDYDRDPNTGKETFPDEACRGYQDNPSAQLLVGRGSSWGGSVKYCLPGNALPGGSMKAYAAEAGVALAITITLELLVVLVYIRIKQFGDWRKLLLMSALASVISLPLLWLLLYSIPGLIIWVAELGVVIFEAWFIRTSVKGINWVEIGLLSVIMNGVSYFVGNMILHSLLS